MLQKNAVSLCAALWVAQAAAAAPLNLVVVDFAAQGNASADLGRALGEVAAAEATRIGDRQVVSTADIAAQLGLERTRQLIGCTDDTGCLVEIAGSLNIDQMLVGTVTLLDTSYLVSVRLLDLRTSRTLARVSLTVKGLSQADVLDCGRRLAHEALTGRKLDTTGLLLLEISQAGASVAIDGAGVGQSPLAGGQRVIEGPHRLLVQKPGYVPWEGTVDVTAGGVSMVKITMVQVAAMERVRRVYAELLGGFVPVSRYGITGTDNCGDGCVGNLGGARGGYNLTEHLGIELFLVPVMYQVRDSRRSLTVDAGGTPTTSDAYFERADVGATLGGVSVQYHLFEQTPLTFRLWAGAAVGYVATSAGGQFPDAPPDFARNFNLPSVSQRFWSAVGGPEVRFGYRFSKGVVMDVGLALLVMFLPSTQAQSGPAMQDQRVSLPPGPAFTGGLSWSLPFTCALHFDF